jgi:aflatoxin B1 aldehyde reductase
MKFMAYSPLAGGFLSGAGPTFAPESALVGSRYEHCENNVNHGPFYRFWYDKEAMHTAVKTLKIAADSYGIDLAEVAIRWLVHHSALKDGDAIIIGPETAEELERSVNAYHGGPLPEELVETIDKLQDIVREDAKTIIQF